MTAAAHARALARRRASVAKLVAPFISDDELGLTEDDDGRLIIACHACDGWPSEFHYQCMACGGAGSTPAHEALTVGLMMSAADGAPRYVPGFDVSRARAYARELIALEVEHAVFVEWTQTQGKGPDNREPGAFMAITKHTVFRWLPSDGTFTFGDGRDDGTPEGGLDVYHLGTKLGRLALDAGPTALALLVANLRARGFDPEVPGGWPGKLASAWGTVPCAECDGKRGAMGYHPHWGAMDPPRWVWCKPCKGTGRTPKPGADRRAPMGRSLARVGRRLLKALKGQPDECQGGCWRSVYGKYMVDVPGLAAVDAGCKTCPDCHGTRHNLRGVLPEVEVAPAMMAALSDGPLASASVDAPWPKWALDAGLTRERVLDWTASRLDIVGSRVTRVVPRGEHREQVPARAQTLDASITARGNVPRHGLQQLPRWRRGELLHAQQRRERARPRHGTLVAIENAVMELDGVRRCEATEDRVAHAVTVNIIEGTADHADVVDAAREFVPAGVELRLRFARVLPAQIEAVEVRGEFTL